MRMARYKMWLLVFLIWPLGVSYSFPQVAAGDTFDDAETDVPGPPVTDAELEASLSDDSLLEAAPEDWPLSTQSQLFQGDIVLESEDELSETILSNETLIQNDAIANANKKWPYAVMPYIISSAFGSRDRAVIVRAFAEIKKRTCIMLTPRNKEKDYVHIKKGNGCYSNIGRTKRAQTLSLGTGCVYFGIVLHELMHAAGFWHEQSRIDRDSHVTINWQNIKNGFEGNFEKLTRSVTKDLGLPYDYGSVMHYGKYAFAINPREQTIISKQSGKEILGQRKGFSELDVKGLNLLYDCEDPIPPKPTGCADTHTQCSGWAKEGECAKNPTYMIEYCKKSCNTCDPIPISKIVDHGGFRHGGAGPENLLQNEGFWNPNPKPWFVVFDLGQSHVVTRFLVTNFGDTTHDMTAFKLETSDDLKSWTQVKTVNNVATGTVKNQTFSLSGTGRYWRFTVTATAKGFQPFLKRVAFFGIPSTSTVRISQIPLSSSNIVKHGGFRPGGAGPEKLLLTEGFWNPNPKPWFVVFNLGRSHVVTSFQVTNFGDTTHDMTAFKLEASEDLESWTQVKTIDNVETGTGKIQTFKLSGTGRFWRFTVTATAKGFQPYLKRVAFFGFPIQCWSESSVPCDNNDVPEGKNFPHPEYCNKFIKCSGGSATVKTCSKGKQFNHHNGFCKRTANFCLCGKKTTGS